MTIQRFVKGVKCSSVKNWNNDKVEAYKCNIDMQEGNNLNTW